MVALQTLASELAITVSNGQVWLSIGQGLLFGLFSLVLGIWVARKVGLLSPKAPAGETLGVGLACGLMVLAAWWAAIWSGGRSSFTPVAVGFAIAVALALMRRPRQVAAEVAAPTEPGSSLASGRRWPLPRRSLVLTTLAGALFVVAVALLYGSTMAPSPRDGVQPVEFMDEAFYSVLGRDLATTGTETNVLPSGFTDVPGLPPQIWYHWGELWLAAALVSIFDAAPLAARHFIVLPVVLLAAAALTGTLARRMTGLRCRRVYLFGFLGSLFLAPMPVIPGPFFSSWAVGLIFGITMYGLAAPAVLLAVHCLGVLGRCAPTWPLAVFVGSAVAFILPAHIVVALLAMVGVVGVSSLRIMRSIAASGGLPAISSIWRWSIGATGVALVATVAWGLLTGHGIGGSGGVPPAVSPFNSSWAESTAITILGAGAFLTIPLVLVFSRTGGSAKTDVYLGTMIVLVAGALVWGARLGDFTMFHFFFGGIAVFATPLTVAAVLVLWKRLREMRALRAAAGLAILCIVQLDIGVPQALLRLQRFGPGDYPPIPTDLLAAVQQLPKNAKLAYGCKPFEEVSFTDPRLVSIDAHTERRVVPMCFEVDYFSTLIGAPLSEHVANAAFAWAPQRALYPYAAARPSSLEVARFLKSHGIDYIYADPGHPDTLVRDAVPVATSGDASILRLP